MEHDLAAAIAVLPIFTMMLFPNIAMTYKDRRFNVYELSRGFSE